MTFNFDIAVNRRSSNSVKWTTAEAQDMLPMWVADMDFKTAPCVIAALASRVEHGVFGYTSVPERYYQAVTDWHASRHNLRIAPEHTLVTTGVVPAISAIIQALCLPGDGVIVQTPAYNCFFTSIRNSQCQLVSNPLIYRNNRYEIDFADLERKARLGASKMLLLCNPHNPSGRSWSLEELSKIAEICLRNNIIIVSDEVHCELTFSGVRHIPVASLSEAVSARTITITSPSKAFNLAGLKIANVLVKNSSFKSRIDKQLNINETCEVSPFAIDAVVAAYTGGQHWLSALLQYIEGNVHTVRQFIDSEIPALSVCRSDATYLVWINCRAAGISSAELESTLRNDYKLWLNAGTIYGERGEGFIRMNVATTRGNVIEGLARLKRFFDAASS